MARPMNPGQVIQGREAVRASLLTRPKTLLTKHLATNAMIEVETRDSARGLSYLTMVATTPPEGAAPPFISSGPIYFGEMQDRFHSRKRRVEVPGAPWIDPDQNLGAGYLAGKHWQLQP